MGDYLTSFLVPSYVDALAYGRWQQWRTKNSLSKDYGRCDCRQEMIITPDLYPLDTQAKQDAAYEKALAYYGNNGLISSISLSPGDSSGIKPNDLVTVANRVQKYFNNRYPFMNVCFLAYADTQAPPTIDLESGVIVMVANGYLRGYDHDELLIEWAKRGATLGVYEYYSDTAWNMGVFGPPRQGLAPWGGARAYDGVTCGKNLKRWYHLGVRHLIAETANDLGFSGMGYEIIARTLNDVNIDPATISSKITSTILGIVAETAVTYDTIVRTQPLSATSVQELFNTLSLMLKGNMAAQGAARRCVTGIEYCRLFLNWQNAPQADKPAALQLVNDHLVRCRGEDVVPALGIMEVLKMPGADADVGEVFTDDEREAFITNGVKGT